GLSCAHTFDPAAVSFVCARCILSVSTPQPTEFPFEGFAGNTREPGGLRLVTVRPPQNLVQDGALGGNRRLPENLGFAGVKQAAHHTGKRDRLLRRRRWRL